MLHLERNIQLLCCIIVYFNRLLVTSPSIFIFEFLFDSSHTHWFSRCIQKRMRQKTKIQEKQIEYAKFYLHFNVRRRSMSCSNKLHIKQHIQSNSCANVQINCCAHYFMSTIWYFIYFCVCQCQFSIVWHHRCTMANCLLLA